MMDTDEQQDEDEEKEDDEAEEELTLALLRQAVQLDDDNDDDDDDDEQLPLPRVLKAVAKEGGGDDDEDEAAPCLADLPHDAACCLICSRRVSGAAAELLRLPDLVFLIWDYLPLSQVWRFQHICPLWKERLQLRPQQPRPSQQRRRQTQRRQQQAERKERKEEETALLVAEDDDDAMIAAADRAEAAVAEEWRAEERAAAAAAAAAASASAAVQWRLEEELLTWGRPRLWMLDEQTPLIDLESGRLRRRGGAAQQQRGLALMAAERTAAAHAAGGGEAGLWLLRGRDRGERAADWRTGNGETNAKRARRAQQQADREKKEEKRDYRAAATVGDSCEDELQPVRGDDGFVAAFASRHTRLLPASTTAAADSNSRAAAAQSSASPSSSSSPAAGECAPSVGCWSSRSYLHRLRQASLSVFPHCTPCLSPEMLASLSSLTSLHLYAFPFVYPVFLAETEGGGREQDAAERLQLQAEAEAYERWERRQEARRERKLMRESCDTLAKGRKEERLQREAQQQQLYGRQSDEEEQQQQRRQAYRSLRHGERPLPAAGKRAMQADDVWLDLPGNGFLLRLQNAQHRDRLQQHLLLVHRARQVPEEKPSPLLALAAVAPQLTTLVYTARTLLSADVRELCCLTRLTSLSLHPAHGELIRPVELIDLFFGSLPELRMLSLYSEEEGAFPAVFIPRLPLLAASLRSLSIHSPAYSLEHVRALAQLVQLTHLSLSFSYEPLPAATFGHFSALRQLSSLCLHTGSRLSWAAPAALFSLSSLTSLSFFGSTNVHESSFHLLSGMPELRRLRVSGSFSIMAELIKGALLSPQLLTLDVRGSALTVRERENLRFKRPDLQLIDC